MCLNTFSLGKKNNNVAVWPTEELELTRLTPTKGKQKEEQQISQNHDSRFTPPYHVRGELLVIYHACAS